MKSCAVSVVIKARVAQHQQGLKHLLEEHKKVCTIRPSLTVEQEGRFHGTWELMQRMTHPVSPKQTKLEGRGKTVQKAVVSIVRQEHQARRWMCIHDLDTHATCRERANNCRPARYKSGTFLQPVQKVVQISQNCN